MDCVCVCVCTHACTCAIEHPRHFLGQPLQTQGVQKDSS